MRSPCCDKREGNRGAWSEEEDQKLVDCIRLHGELVSWRSIPEAAGLLRCGKSCRLRWINYLRPDVKRGSFKEDEEDLIIKLHALLGNRWSLIAGRLPGRTDNEVKNHWNSHLKKRLRSMGVDPDNHRLSAHNASLIRPSQSRLNYPREATVSGSGGSGGRASVNERALDHQQNGRESSVARLPDLNLDLTISPPSAVSEKRPGSDGSAEAETTTMATHLENKGKPITLSLSFDNSYEHV